MKQRAGRAGRVQPGLCVRMVSEKFYESGWIQEQPPVDMDVLPLENLLLQIVVAAGGELRAVFSGGDSGAKAPVALDDVEFDLADGPGLADGGSSKGKGKKGKGSSSSKKGKSSSKKGGKGSSKNDASGGGDTSSTPSTKKILRRILSFAPSPPSEIAINAGLNELVSIGALLEDEQNDENLTPTPLGRHISKLSCDTRIAKLLLYSAILGTPAEGCSLAGVLSVRSPLELRPELEQIQSRAKYRNAYLKPGGSRSDHCLLAQLGLEPAQFFSREKCEALGVSGERLREARKLRDNFAQNLRQLGFDCGDFDGTNNWGSGGGTRTGGGAAVGGAKHRWYLLRAACVASFFLVRGGRPFPKYKKITGLAAVECVVKPNQVEYQPLGVVGLAPAGGATAKPGQNLYYAPSPSSVLSLEAPGSLYICHTDIGVWRGRQELETMSEASSIATLLVGTFNEQLGLDFRGDGLISVGEGKLIFSTTGQVVEEQVLKDIAAAACAGNKSAGTSAGSKSAGTSSGAPSNTLISQLVKLLRKELQSNILARKLADPGYDLEANELLGVIKRLLGTDGMGGS